MYTFNKIALHYMKQKLVDLPGKIDKFTILAGHFNVFFSLFDRTSRQKITSIIQDLKTVTASLTYLTVCPIVLHSIVLLLNLTEHYTQ